MTQTRPQSAIEAAISIVIGFGVSVMANRFVLPLFGYQVTMGESALIGIPFTFISFARGYLVRRFFNWWHGVR